MYAGNKRKKLWREEKGTAAPQPFPSRPAAGPGPAAPPGARGAPSAALPPRAPGRASRPPGRRGRRSCDLPRGAGLFPPSVTAGEPCPGAAGAAGRPLSRGLPAPESPWGSVSGRGVGHVPPERARWPRGAARCARFPRKTPFAAGTRWSLAPGGAQPGWGGPPGVRAPVANVI